MSKIIPSAVPIFNDLFKHLECNLADDIRSLSSNSSITVVWTCSGMMWHDLGG